MAHLKNKAILGGVLGLIVTAAWGCGERSGTRAGLTWDAQELQNERFSRNNSALIFASAETREGLGSRGLDAGFFLGDWEYSRNDGSVGAGRGLEWRDDSDSVIWQEERLYQTNGRPYTQSRTVIRTVSTGNKQR